MTRVTGMATITMMTRLTGVTGVTGFTKMTGMTATLVKTSGDTNGAVLTLCIQVCFQHNLSSSVPRYFDQGCSRLSHPSQLG